MNGVWSKQWWGDWELVLLVDGGHAEGAQVVLVLLVQWYNGDS